MKNRKITNWTRRDFLKKTGLAAASAAVPSILYGCSQGDDFDVLIKGGLVYDGTLAEPRIADLGIKNGLIAAVGNIEGGAAKTINAQDLMVTPGLIDIHTHCDLTFKNTGMKRYMAYFMPSWKGNHNYLYQGVTTVVSGNCGYGYDDAAYWFDLVDSVGFGTNVAHLAPHGMIREALFGENQPAELNPQQLERLKGRVFDEMEKGAVGLSAGLEYAPGLLAPTKEYIELCKVVRNKGGLFTIHMRDESGAVNDGKPGILRSIEETVEIARRAEIPVEISHLKISVPFSGVEPNQLQDLIEEARQQGLDITADQYPYDAGSTYITYLLPDEFKTSNSVKDEYKTKEGRIRIVEAINKVFTYLGPDKTLITMYPQKESYEGKTIAELAEFEGREPTETYVDMVCEDVSPMGVFFAQDENVVRALMPRDYMITASDGWTVPKDMTRPHPRTYGTFPRKLRRYVMDDKLMTLSQAVRSMTSLPAEKFKLKNRGRIDVGQVADVAVFNPKTITDHATYQDPHQYSEGLVFLLVAGVLSVENGRATGDRAGRALKLT